MEKVSILRVKYTRDGQSCRAAKDLAERGGHW